MKYRIVAGLFFLSLQLASIIYARFVPERFFCWAPYDEHTYYEIEIDINGKYLSPFDIEQRYKYAAKGWEPRSIYNVFNIINQYESTYGQNDNAKVNVTYSINGQNERLWLKK